MLHQSPYDSDEDYCDIGVHSRTPSPFLSDSIVFITRADYESDAHIEQSQTLYRQSYQRTDVGDEQASDFSENMFTILQPNTSLPSIQSCAHESTPQQHMSPTQYSVLNPLGGIEPINTAVSSAKIDVDNTHVIQDSSHFSLSSLSNSLSKFDEPKLPNNRNNASSSWLISWHLVLSVAAAAVVIGAAFLWLNSSTPVSIPKHKAVVRV